MAKKKTRKGGLVKAIRNIAKSEALKQQETKYTTQTVLNNLDLTNQLVSQFAPGNTSRLNIGIPPLQLGTTYSELIGSKMTLVSGYTKFHFTLNYDNTATQEVIVKLFLLTSKTVKAVQSALSGLYGSDLLKLSNYQQDWKPSLADPRILNMLPLNDNAWSGRIHTFKLSKNGGGMNGDKTVGVAPPANIANHPSYHEFKWQWGKDKLLKYDTPAAPPTNPQFVYPTNCCPFLEWLCIILTAHLLEPMVILCQLR